MGIFGGKVLFYPGCVTKFFLKDVLQNYERLLNIFGIKYIKLEMEKCCGLEALEAGYRRAMHDVMEMNEGIFRANRVSKIITNCPRCFSTFNEFYNVKTEHMVDVILNNVNKLKPKEGKITYYDPCTLGRKCGLYDEPRQILEAVGYEVVDLHKCKDKTLCCGAGGGLKRNAPMVANRVAKILLSQVKTGRLVTSDPLCYKHMKENAKDLEVLELSEVLV